MLLKKLTDQIGSLIGQVDSLRKGDYAFEQVNTDDGRSYFISRADLKVGDGLYPCDTTIDLDPGQRPGSERVTFTTPILDGVSGDNEDRFSKVAEVLSYNYPGKFVR